MGFDDYNELGETGFAGPKAQTAPEDEVFHSLYIGTNRNNEDAGLIEEQGKIQIRGVDYNKNSVSFIILHVKRILVKEQTDPRTQNKKTICFSYQNTDPWVGYGQRPCCRTSAEREAHEFCNGCKAQIIIAGIYCEPSGKPIKNDDGSPIYVFIRAKGMKYGDASQYLSDMYKLEGLDPIFEPQTKESNAFEKTVVNNKRFVTTVTPDQEKSRYGKMIGVFRYEKGKELPKDTVKKILDIGVSTLDDFNEKFDWSKNDPSTGQSTGYGGAETFEDTPKSGNTDGFDFDNEDNEADESASIDEFDF